MADFSLYPQPPQPQSNALITDPTKMLDLVGTARGLRAKQAIGNAFQGAIDGNGNFDSNAALNAVKNSPDATYAAPEAVSTILEARGKNIVNATNQFGLITGQNDYVRNMVGALTDKPGRITKDDVAGVFSNLSRIGVPTQILQSTFAGLPDDPAGLKKAIANINTTALGVKAAGTRITAPPDASGAPQQTSAAAPGYGSPTAPTDLPPGGKEALGAPATEYVADQARGAQILSNTRPLQQALPLIGQLSSANFGPGSPEFAKIKGALITAGVVNPDTSDLQIRQEANKYLLKYAAGAVAAGRSDAALSAALGSNPNLDLTQPANLKLIKNQIGMDRQDAALTASFRADNPDLATNPAKMQKYLDHKNNYYASTDSRAFAFDVMTPQERADLQKSLGAKDSPAYKKFVKSYNMAKAAGMLTPQQAPGNGQ